LFQTNCSPSTTSLLAEAAEKFPAKKEVKKKGEEMLHRLRLTAHSADFLEQSEPSK
jgi:hypothetical protein